MPNTNLPSFRDLSRHHQPKPAWSARRLGEKKSWRSCCNTGKRRTLTSLQVVLDVGAGETCLSHDSADTWVDKDGDDELLELDFDGEERLLLLDVASSLMGLGSLEGGDEGDDVAVRFATPANVGGAGGDVGVPSWLAVVHVDVVDDDVGDILEGYASTASDVNVDAAAVDGLEAVDNELVFELNGHVGREGDPEGFVLDDGVAEHARS
ncbi:hypothetical protein ACFX2J_029788 [Malus domestica]